MPWKITMNSMEPCVIWICPTSSEMEFHWTLVIFDMAIPWNSVATKYHIAGFHGIPYNFTFHHFIDTRLPWTSFGYSVELLSRNIRCHQVPWNYMELIECQFKWQPVSLDFHGIFYGPWNSFHSKLIETVIVPWNSIELFTWFWASMEFHRIW